MNLTDPLDMFAKQAAMEADAAKNEARFQAVTKKLFGTATGKDWLRRMMHRSNFMGSVFLSDDGMNPANAAYRDGGRAVLSEILNILAATNTTTEDDE